ncbi:MAG: cytochrome c family protein [Candidatus Tectimicrobiota bacterium]
MKTFLKVFAFNVAIIAFFLYVGNSIPQLRQDPPKELVLAADAPVEDFVAAGETLFKVGCEMCHKIGKKGDRCPDLAGLGARAEARLKEASYKGRAKSGAEYIVESLHEPTAYVVEGYQPIMPALGRQYSDLEMVALVAFLQAQGGEATVNGSTRFATWRGEGGGTAPAAAAPAAAAAAPGPSGGSGPDLVKQWGCVACHQFEGPDRLVGPSLWDIGARKDAAYIRESLLEPDAVVAEGFPGGVMQGTLDGTGFYQKVSIQDLNSLVHYLTSLKGGK